MAHDLTKTHTKVLLKMLESARVTGAYWCDDYGYDTIPLADIKAELAKRPHIPNKQESKKLRQEAAKRKR